MRFRTCKLKSLEKTGFGGKGQSPIPPLNNFGNFSSFFQKNSDFCAFVVDYTQLDLTAIGKKKIGES